jgi:transposase InsO family protein
VLRIQALREQYPRWGREKLRVLLEREGIVVSAKTIDRTVTRLRARGVLREPLRPQAARKARRTRPRRPSELVVDAPGVLVQLDTKEVALERGRKCYQFAAVDYFTRKRVVALAPSLQSRMAAAFLHRLVERFPFPVSAVQSDGGSEFMKEFGQAASGLGLTHYVTAPYHPQSNGRVERAFRTDEEEFYQVAELPAGVPALENALQHWNQVYETVRPHQALGYLTPDEFFKQWQTQRKEAVSDM